MRKTIPLLSVLLLLPAQVLLAQEYFEATGATAVFTLVDPISRTEPAKVVQPPAQTMKLVLVSNNRVNNQWRITGGIPGIARLYQLNGRQVGSWPVGISGLLTLNRHFSTEVYVLRFEPKGMPAKTFRLPIMFEGGRP